MIRGRETLEIDLENARPSPAMEILARSNVIVCTWDKLPKEVVMSASLLVSKEWLENALRDMV